MRRRLDLPADARLALERRTVERPLWQRLVALRSLAAADHPRAMLDAALGALAPVLRGERVLAVMPFFVELLRRGDAADVLDTEPEHGPGGRRTLIAGTLGRVLGRFREPPTVF